VTLSLRNIRLIRSSKGSAATGAVIAMIAAASVGGALPASAAPSRDNLAGSVPPWAKPANFVTGVDPSTPVPFRVYLTWQGGSSAAGKALAVSTPGSPSYRKFLTPSEFRREFAPSQADVGAVRSWLRDAGFDIDAVPTNNLYVAGFGTAAQVESAFNTTLGYYKVSGQTLFAPESAPSVPADLNVSSVMGLDQSADLVRPDHTGKDAPPSAGFRVGHPCSAYYGEQTTTAPEAYGRTTFPVATCGYTPQQIQGAYGLKDLIKRGVDGTGQTVAIIDAFASPTIFDDVNTYSQRHDLPLLTHSQFTQVTAPGTAHHPNNNRMDPSGWYGEQTLDVEAVHMTAPGADIVYVGSPNNNQDLDAALNDVVDRHLAQIVSNSYGFASELLPPGFEKPFNDIAIEAAATGVGLYFSSGDSGDELENTGLAQPDWPASDAFVTAVGGTSLAVGASDGRLFETGWETGLDPINDFGTPDASYAAAPPGAFSGGAGGGTSRVVPEPAYQVGVVPNELATRWSSNPGRVVPDIAALGDPNTGLLVGQTQTFSDGTYYDEYRIGGTSVACPLVAGMMALADQLAGSPHGFANPAIYAQSGRPGLYDVVQNPTGQQEAVVRVNYNNNENANDGLGYSLRTLDHPGQTTLATAPGYDDITGVGTIMGEAFLGAV
jgi:subtilase family serine protease